MGIRQKTSLAIFLLMIALSAIPFLFGPEVLLGNLPFFIPAVFFVGFLAIFVIVNIALTQFVIAPTKELDRAMKLAKTGIFDTRVEIKARDELGWLAENFNQMLNSLEMKQYKSQAHAKHLKESFDEAKIQANTDTLTQLFNRRYLEKQLSIFICKSLAEQSSLAVIFCDLDGFKEYNDRYGHQEGDEALKAVSLIIKASLRETDIAARYGGEEFALVMVDTDLAGAKSVSDRIRRAVENFAGRNDGDEPGLTISIGIAMLTSMSQTVDSLIGKADQAMYQAKHEGKNRIVVSGQSSSIKTVVDPFEKLELKY